MFIGYKFSNYYAVLLNHLYLILLLKVATTAERSDGFHLHDDKDSTTEDEDDEDNENEEESTMTRSHQREKPTRQELHVTVPISTTGATSSREPNISPNMLIPSSISLENKGCRMEGLLQFAAPQTATSVEPSMRR